MDVGSLSSKQKSTCVVTYANKNIATNQRNQNLTKVFQSFSRGNVLVKMQQNSKNESLSQKFEAKKN